MAYGSSARREEDVITSIRLVRRWLEAGWKYRNLIEQRERGGKGLDAMIDAALAAHRAPLEKIARSPAGIPILCPTTRAIRDCCWIDFEALLKLIRETTTTPTSLRAVLAGGKEMCPALWVFFGVFVASMNLLGMPDEDLVAGYGYDIDEVIEPDPSPPAIEQPLDAPGELPRR